MQDISLGKIVEARVALAGKVRRTPVNASDSLSARIGAPVLLKLEHQQMTGSFKLRGATNAIQRLSPEERARGVVGVSTGNHGRGLAHAARLTGTACAVCMSRLVPSNKVDAIRALGADVRIIGNSQDDAAVEADRLVAEVGMTMVPPFDHPDIIAGQGTIGMEIVEDVPDVETVIVPLSGGGLIAGMARAIKGLNPAIRVIGVTMENGAAMHESLLAGHLVDVAEVPSLADSLGGGIGPENHYTMAMVRDLVDQRVLVSESEIADAVRHAYNEERQVIEGGAAVGIAALLSGKVSDTGRTVLVLSGANINMDLHRRIINNETDGPGAEA